MKWIQWLSTRFGGRQQYFTWGGSWSLAWECGTNQFGCNDRDFHRPTPKFAKEPANAQVKAAAAALRGAVLSSLLPQPAARGDSGRAGTAHRVPRWSPGTPGPAARRGWVGDRERVPCRMPVHTRTPGAPQRRLGTGGCAVRPHGGRPRESGGQGGLYPARPTLRRPPPTPWPRCRWGTPGAPRPAQAHGNRRRRPQPCTSHPLPRSGSLPRQGSVRSRRRLLPPPPGRISWYLPVR